MPRPFAYIALHPGRATHARFDLEPFKLYGAVDVTLIDGEPPSPAPTA